MIRWATSVVRLVAYYANLPLISSFLGLGVGAMLARKRKSMFEYLPFLLAGNRGVMLNDGHFLFLGLGFLEANLVAMRSPDFRN